MLFRNNKAHVFHKSEFSNCYSLMISAVKSMEARKKKKRKKIIPLRWNPSKSQVTNFLKTSRELAKAMPPFFFKK